MDLDKLPGLRPEQTFRLHEGGIRTTRQLLLAARCQDHFASLAGEIQLPIETLREVIARAQLGELRGIGPKSLEHLSAVGIQSLHELAVQEPAELRAVLRGIAAHPPNLAILEHWIRQARQLQTGPIPSNASGV